MNKRRSVLRTLARTAISMIFLYSAHAFGQDALYQAGFKIIRTYDSSRTYKPGCAISDKLHFRPIDIDLWYPADVTSSDTTAAFADLVHLLEIRSNFYDDTRNYRGLTDELLQYICGAFDCPDFNALKRIRTDSYVNAKQIAQKFPLIIYLAGFNGMSYENYLLFERLAQNGFVIASVSSIGRYPGNMTMDSVDLFEQIEDAKYIIHEMTKRNFCTGDIGLVGYSWGGLAAAILAMSNRPEIKAVVSLDGSEQFVYNDEEESEKLKLIRKSTFFKPEAITSAFLSLDSDITEWDNLPDSIYNMTDAIPGDKYYLRIDHAAHEDFSSLGVISAGNQSNTRYKLIERLTVSYLRDKLKSESNFLRNIPQEGVTKQFAPPVSKNISSEEKKILKGFIRDNKSNLPLSYVNIGILNRDKGTTTNSEGRFDLAISESNINDTLKISMIGYESRTIYLKDILKNQKLTLNILLSEKSTELKEIVVIDKKLRSRSLGNRSESKFIGGKFASGDLGSEIAIKIKIRKAPTYLEKFNFNISYNTADTATIRVNIYEIKNGLPGRNILAENIILETEGQTGKIEVDLTKYNIEVNDDFFIALEWIEGQHNSGIVFSAGFANKGTYYRKASQGRWKKYPMGVGFNVSAKY